MPESTGVTLGFVQFLYDLKSSDIHPFDDHLGNSVSATKCIGLCAQIDDRYFYFTPTGCNPNFLPIADAQTLSVIPISWALSGALWFYLGMVEDAGLVIAGVVGIVMLVGRARVAQHATSAVPQP